MADNVQITAGTGTTIRTDDVGGVQYPYTKLDVGGDGVSLPVIGDPTGAIIVNNGHATLFYDAWSFSPIDTTDKWTVTGTTPTVAAGVMTMVATASTYNAIRTKDTIRPNSGFTYVANGIALETATATGAGRFWGLGTPATTPAAAVLVQDGVGFEVDQATGALLAVTYAAGVRTTVATLTRPTDGLNHRYALYFRVTQAFWHVDNLSLPVASASFPNVQVAELPALIVRQNAAAFTGTPAFTNTAHLTADTSRQTTVVADPVVGTRQARVGADGALRVRAGDATNSVAIKGASTAAAASDPAEVVALSPNSPLPAGANHVGYIAAATLAVTATATANTALTLTIPAPGAGLFIYLTLLEFTRTATAALAGTATIVVTSTNLPGSEAWSFGNAMAAGGEAYRQIQYANAKKASAANTAVTIVTPAPGAAVLWRVTAHYYAAA